MIDKLGEALRFNGRALALRAERQAVIASNIANADTPGYRAVDFDFARALRDATSSSGAAAPRLVESPAPLQAAADGNGVDMDRERANFADNAIRYEAALRSLNGQLKALMDAIRG